MSQFTKAPLDHERITSNTNDFETERFHDTFSDRLDRAAWHERLWLGCTQADSGTTTPAQEPLPEGLPEQFSAACPDTPRERLSGVQSEPHLVCPVPGHYWSAEHGFGVSINGAGVPVTGTVHMVRRTDKTNPPQPLQLRGLKRCFATPYISM